jgi:carbonic anhydrase/acetyltransferase-like protein (isoleucine patch superfamily)
MLSKFRSFRLPLQRFFSKNLTNEEIDHQVFNRQSKLISLNDYIPIITESRSVADSAVLIGEAGVAARSFVGDFSVLKGDLNLVKVCNGSIVFENCILSTISELDKTGQRAWVYLNNETMVMPGTTIVSAELDKGANVGPRSVICEGAKIGENSIIGARSVVPPYRYIPPHQLWVGNPVRYVKDLSKQEMISIRLLKKSLIDIKMLEAQNSLSISTQVLEKEILDELELDLKNEEISVQDLENALNLLTENGYEIYFVKELVELARQRLESKKSMASLKESTAKN